MLSGPDFARCRFHARKENQIKIKIKKVEILLHIAGVECRGLDATTTEVGGHFLMDQEPQFFSLRGQRASCIQKYSSRPCTTATNRTRGIRHRGIPHGARIPPTFPVVFVAGGRCCSALALSLEASPMDLPVPVHCLIGNMLGMHRCSCRDMRMCDFFRVRLVGLGEYFVTPRGTFVAPGGIACCSKRSRCCS